MKIPALACLLTAILITAQTAQANPHVDERATFINSVRPKLKEGCAILAGTTLNHWKAFEREEAIACLETAYLPHDEFDHLMNEFLDECTEALVIKMEPLADGRVDFNVTMSRAELTDIFARHYGPRFRQYCQDKNPQLENQFLQPGQSRSIKPWTPPAPRRERRA